MNIALIGFRGTGKTTIGKKLAKRLNMRFVDIDREIAKKEKKTIPQIFAQAGEKGFRELEKAAVKEFSLNENLCIACGGGVVLDKGNIDSLKRNSTIILLEARPETIHIRIRNDRSRPGLTDKRGFEEILHLLAERKQKYDEAAMMRFDTSDATPNETVQNIIDELNTRGLL